MQIKNFKDMYIAELQELANMESQIDIALKRMADASSHPSANCCVTARRRRNRASGCNQSCKIMARNCAPIPIRPWERT